MRFRKLGVFVAVAVACVAAPAATAQAEPACGTTPEQWVGTFPGFTHWGWTEDTAFDNRITEENGVLGVERLNPPDNAPPPFGTPAVDGDSLTWAEASTYPGGPGYSSVYTTTSVTCANGVVQSFAGNEHWVYSGVLGNPYFENDTEFSASRS